MQKPYTRSKKALGFLILMWVILIATNFWKEHLLNELRAENDDLKLKNISMKVDLERCTDALDKDYKTMQMLRTLLETDNKIIHDKYFGPLIPDPTDPLTKHQKWECYSPTQMDKIRKKYEEATGAKFDNAILDNKAEEIKL